ncbi:tetratricopeptide repeat protein [Blastopirellula sp. JC732]|uniref:Tetratricopeptide repeat protein n=1 Tax=Blastopirellula sediminis TaxID=2894196 RepID=A0A9X1SIN2_9BACT|nr:tetratricopeptide repeat protein [Blastopirellula sediminis]MCC9605699.1 tetratricopeptide repeat protein [Blastopirellula sediminis]MCC9631001.1 tetratricopeptide repeat protein [Blastopirellula sediminis]
MPIRHLTLPLAGSLVIVLMFACIVWGQVTPPEAAIVYSDAVAFQKAEEYKLASEEWSKFLTRYPNDVLAEKARNNLAVCQLKLEKYSDAASNFFAILKNNPKTDLREDALLNLGSTYYSWAKTSDPKQFDSAAKTFEQLYKEYPKGKNADQALYFAGESFYLSGQKERSLGPYKALVEQFTQSPYRADGAYAWGVTLEELNKPGEAADVYGKFLAAFPQHDLAAEVRMRQAETMLTQNDFAKAEQTLTAVTADPKFPLIDHALYRLAFARLKQDKVAEAGAVYAKLANDYPQSKYHDESLMLAGRCYYRAGNWSEAAKLLGDASKLPGDSGLEAAHWLCRVYLKNGKPQDAEKLAASKIAAAKESPQLVPLLIDQADALYDQPNRRGESVKLYQQIVTQHPKDPQAPQALYNGAFAALETQDYATASRLAKTFVDQFPKHDLLLDAKYVAAEAALQEKKYADADKMFRELIAAGDKRPEKGKWQMRLALALLLQEKHNDIIAFLSPTAGKLTDPALKAEAFFLLGSSQFALDQFPAAQQSLAASLAAKADWRQADETLILLSRTMHKQGDNASAIATVQKMQQQFPSSSLGDHAAYRLGEYYYAAADYPNAAKQYKLVADKFGSSPLAPHALYGLGWSHIQQQQGKEATDAFTQLLTKHGNHELAPQTLHARAVSRRLAGDFAGAAGDVDAYLQKAPQAADKADALYLKGLCLVGANDQAGAAAQFAALKKEFPKYENDDKVLYELAWSLKASGNGAKGTETFAELAATHPQSPLAAEANYHVGEAAYDRQDYAAANKAYSAALAAAKAEDVGEKSAYKLGWSNYQLGDYAAASDAFAVQTSKYAGGPLAADASFMRGECLYKQDKFADALSAYGQVQAEKLSSNDMRDLWRLHAGQSAAQLKKWDESIRWMNDLLAKSPDSPVAAEAEYEIGWANYNQKKVDDAIKRFTTAADLSPGRTGARARFMLGELYFEKKDYEAAEGQFKRVVLGFGGAKSVDEVKPWQAKAAYELGRCNEVRIRDAVGAPRVRYISEAKKYYGMVVSDYPQTPEAKLAAGRLDAINKL